MIKHIFPSHETGDTLYTYDEAGNVSGITYPDGGGNLITEECDDGTVREEAFTYVYEAEDRLKAVYDPSGQAMRATSTNRYQKTFYAYNAESYDPKIGSVYLRARYYNTRTGSFSTKDTYLGSLMDPLSLNRYSYKWGNPVNYLDPSGHDAILINRLIMWWIKLHRAYERIV